MGIQEATAPLRSVYVRAPNPANADSWEAYGWREPQDVGAVQEQHAGFCQALASLGAEVVVGSTLVPGDIDDIYAYDPLLHHGCWVHRASSGQDRSSR